MNPPSWILYSAIGAIVFCIIFMWWTNRYLNEEGEYSPTTKAYSSRALQVKRGGRSK